MNYLKAFKILFVKWLKLLLSLIYNLARPGVHVESAYVNMRASIGEGSEIKPSTVIDRQTVIGKYVYIGHSCNVTRATIGSYCSIANRVSIGQGEHDINRSGRARYL